MTRQERAGRHSRQTEAGRSDRATEPRAARLPRVVIALGWVSLLTDLASDMVIPLVPALLASKGAPPLALGLFEGVGELVAALSKLVSGRIADRARSRKGLIALGYGLSALTRPLYALAALPALTVAIRALDRVGKGLRGPPRDALIADATTGESRAVAFGFHRMMDNLGGVFGPLLAFALVGAAGLRVDSVFMLSLAPGLAAVCVVLVCVKDVRLGAPVRASSGAPQNHELAAPNTIEQAPLGRGVARYLVALAVFAFASSSDLFLLQRLADLGLPTALVPIAWVSLQVAKSALNVPGGRLADRVGRRRAVVFAFLVYALSYAALGAVTSWAAGWAVLALYAIYYGLAEGAQRALVAEYVPAAARGRAYGAQLAIDGALVLPANVSFALVYQRYGAELAFFGTSAVAAIAALILVVWVPEPAGQSRSQRSHP